jgi:hypothetical protein
MSQMPLAAEYTNESIAETEPLNLPSIELSPRKVKLEFTIADSPDGARIV